MRDPSWTYSKLAVILIFCGVLIVGCSGLAVVLSLLLGSSFPMAGWQLGLLGVTIFSILAVQVHSVWEVLALHFILPDLTDGGHEEV